MHNALSAALVAVVSPKGGVGKTTVAANLAAAFAARGRPVLLVDLDPQNAARLHHQVPWAQTIGLATQTLSGEPWADAVFRGPFGVECLPHGTLDEREREAFERRVAADPHWLADGLRSLALAGDTVVVVDTPPGGGPCQRQALLLASLALVVLLPDAASFVTVPSMHRVLEDLGNAGDTRYVINRMNAARTLCRDVASALREQLGDQLIDVQIRFDAAVEEALASQSPVQHYAPTTSAARDFEALAERVSGEL